MAEKLTIREFITLAKTIDFRTVSMEDLIKFEDGVSQFENVIDSKICARLKKGITDKYKEFYQGERCALPNGVELMYAGDTPPIRELDPIGVTDLYIKKPSGGLWTSLFNPKTGQSEWMDYITRQNNEWHAKGAKLWHIVPSKDCKILVLQPNSPEMEKYRIPGNDALDYQKISQDYDAVYVSDETLYKDSAFDKYSIASCFFFRKKKNDKKIFHVLTSEQYVRYLAKNKDVVRKANDYNCGPTRILGARTEEELKKALEVYKEIEIAPNVKITTQDVLDSALFNVLCDINNECDFDHQDKDSNLDKLEKYAQLLISAGANIDHEIDIFKETPFDYDLKSKLWYYYDEDDMDLWKIGKGDSLAAVFVNSGYKDIMEACDDCLKKGYHFHDDDYGNFKFGEKTWFECFTASYRAYNLVHKYERERDKYYQKHDNVGEKAWLAYWYKNFSNKDFSDISMEAYKGRYFVPKHCYMRNQSAKIGLKLGLNPFKKYIYWCGDNSLLQDCNGKYCKYRLKDKELAEMIVDYALKSGEKKYFKILRGCHVTRQLLEQKQQAMQKITVPTVSEENKVKTEKIATIKNRYQKLTDRYSSDLSSDTSDELVSIAQMSAWLEKNL